MTFIETSLTENCAYSNNYYNTFYRAWLMKITIFITVHALHLVHKN